MGLFDFLKQGKKENNNEVKNDNNVNQNEYKQLTKEDVMKIEDDNELFEIVQKGYCGTSITECAVSRMKNQRQLEDLLNCLVSFTDRQRKEAIISGLTDQEFLCDLYIDEEDYDWSKKILARINDEKVVKKVLLNSNKKIKRYGELINMLNEDDQKEVLEKTKSSDMERIEYLLLKIKDDKYKTDYILEHNDLSPSVVTNIKDFNELHRIYNNTKNDEIKQQAYKEIGIFTCKKCGKENIPMTIEEKNCQCKYCGEDNHEWEHVDNVTDYRDYSAGARYDICKRCKQRKNEQIINTM